MLNLATMHWAYLESENEFLEGKSAASTESELHANDYQQVSEEFDSLAIQILHAEMSSGPFHEATPSDMETPLVSDPIPDPVSNTPPIPISAQSVTEINPST